MHWRACMLSECMQNACMNTKRMQDDRATLVPPEQQPVSILQTAPSWCGWRGMPRGPTTRRPTLAAATALPCGEPRCCCLRHECATSKKRKHASMVNVKPSWRRSYMQIVQYASQQRQQLTLHPILYSYKEGEYGGFLVLSAQHWCLWLCPASGCCVSDDPEYRCLTIDSAVRHHILHHIIKCEHVLAGANAGLKVARDLLEPIKEKFPWISYADLWTLAGATALEEMGGACPKTRPLSCQQMHGCCGAPAAVFCVTACMEH